MKVEVTDVSPVRKTMVVEADEAEVATERKAVLDSYRRKASIPGFRPGKAPMKVIEGRFAKEVREDLRDRLVGRLYSDAIEKEGIRVLGEPSLDEVAFDEGAPFRMKASFEVLPRFTVKNYKEVEVRRPAVRLEEGEIDTSLEELRQAHTKLVPEEGRVAATGDFLVVDVDGAPEGGEPFHHEGTVIEVGAPNNLPEFNERLEGATADAELEFPVKYPAEYEHKDLAGKTVGYKIRVREVKRKQVPELDDEFAKDLGDFEGLADLRNRIRDDLLARKKVENEQGVRHSVLDKVLLENPIPLPESLVQEEVRHRMEDVARMMVAQGMDPRTAEVDWKQVRERQEEPSRKTVHARLILDAVTEAESITISDEEVESHLKKEAERLGETYQKLRARVDKDDGLEIIKNQLVREKSLDFLVSVANIQEEE